MIGQTSQVAVRPVAGHESPAWGHNMYLFERDLTLPVVVTDRLRGRWPAWWIGWESAEKFISLLSSRFF